MMTHCKMSALLWPKVDTHAILVVLVEFFLEGVFNFK